ncbi:hypothetical protein [Clostridium akagii]|uniref:hypothetical protein n=1 Tax=Clostridium akagii TaxID=91623 RepID=UPI00047E1DD4|nr:hypothetical protein [Clostridium akagii]
MKKTKEKIKCELVDIQQFLNLSRTIIRQIKLIKNSDISEEYYEITKNAAAKVANEIENFRINDRRSLAKELN